VINGERAGESNAFRLVGCADDDDVLGLLMLCWSGVVRVLISKPNGRDQSGGSGDSPHPRPRDDSNLELALTWHHSHKGKQNYVCKREMAGPAWKESVWSPGTRVPDFGFFIMSTMKTMKHRQRKAGGASSDVDALPQAPKVPRTYKRPHFDPDLSFHRSVLVDKLSHNDAIKAYREKAKEMHAHMHGLVSEINKRYTLERNVDKLQAKLKRVDARVERVFRDVKEKYY
jgi:hypothetical protein